MTKADIIEKINATTGLSKKDSAVMMESVFTIIKESLETGEIIKISGFGNFEITQKAARISKGHIVAEPTQAKLLGEYFAAIIMMASFPDPDYPPEYKVSCRRRPDRKSCKEELAGWIEPDSDDIFWICPKCQDRGLISNWQGTIYDMSDIGDIFH